MSSLTVFEHKNSIDCKQGAVRAIRYNVDGSYCLTCGSDKKIKLWNPASGLLLKTYGGHGNEVTDAAGSCDSCYIVSSSLDKSIIYWDVSTGLPVRRLRGHAGGVTCVRFNEESSLAISGGRDNKVMCYDIRTRNLDPVQIMKEAKDCISSLVVTEFKIIAASLDGSIRHYDIRAGELTTDAIEVPVTYITQTKDGQCVLAACQDNVCRLIDNDSGEILSEYKGHKALDYQIECGILSSDSQVVSGSIDGSAILWDLIDQKEVSKLRVGNSVVHSLATHPTRNEVIFACKRDIHVWSSESDE